MQTITLTEFRKQASGILTQVEQGERFIIIRHSQPVAEMIPYDKSALEPSWRRPALRLQRSGASLAAAILAERNEEA